MNCLRAHRQPLWALLLLGTGTVVLFGRALFLGETFFERDLAAYYRPAKSLLAPLARASQGLPLWNPFFGQGQPFAANPEHELFHPLTTLFFLLPFEVAFRLQVILPVMATAIGMFVFLRSLHRSQPASLFGALSFASGGYLLSLTNLLPSLFSVSVLPWTLAALVHAFRHPRLRGSVGLGLCITLQCLSGEATVLLMTMVLSAAVLASQRRACSMRKGGILALAAVLGTGLASAAILPGLHFAGKTDRATGLSDSEASDWSMPPVRALELLAPDVLGRLDTPVPDDTWGRALYPTRKQPLVYSLYPGLMASMLGLAMLVTRQRRRLVPWALVAGAGYLVALGSHAPLWAALRHLPWLSGLRFPEKFSLLFIFALVVVAACGFDQFLMRPGKRGLMLAWAFGGLALSSLLAFLAVHLLTKSPNPGTRLHATAQVALHVAVVAAAALLALRAPGTRRGRGFAITCLCAADLFFAGRHLVPTVPSVTLAQPPAYLQPLVARQSDELLFNAAAWSPDLRWTPGLARPPLPAQWGLATTLESDYDRTFLRWTNQATFLFWDIVRAHPRLSEPLLERRGVTAIVSPTPTVRAPVPNLPPVQMMLAQKTQPVLFPLSRVEVVRGSMGYRDAVERLGDLAAETAIVDEQELATFPARPSPAKVEILERTPERLLARVEVETAGAAFLAFNQTWDEGWRARIDGVPARLLRTDICLCGLPVPAGIHRIAIEFDDPWMTRGLLLSFMFALACLGLLLLDRRLDRRATSV
jgi:hypothetical protein